MMSKKYPFIVIALILISTYLTIGTGRLHLSSGVPLYVNILYLTLSSLLFLHFKKGFWIFFIFYFFLCFYAPIGLLYGEINESFVFAIWGTYGSEANEFAKTLPLKYLIFSLSSIVLILYFYKITEKINLKSRKTIIMLMVFLLFTALTKPIGIATTHTFDKSIKLFKQSYDDVKLYANTKIQPQWKIERIQPKYKNFVVVIGESARRDYFEIYGYSVKNTPFLRQVHGTFVDGYSTVGLNTIPSLKFALSHNGNLNLNIVDLANQAGFETFWLSNHGKFSSFNTRNTLVAQRAKSLYFLIDDKSIKEKWDTYLIHKAGEILSQKSDKNRVIFIHTYGSHPKACMRLKSKDYLNYTDKKTFEINCYVKTIEQTDNDLRLLYEILEANRQKTGESFSMIYFSDHGLTHNYKKNPIQLAVLSNPSKEHFGIPLLKISSDDTERKMIKNESFSNYFPQSFAHWLGVKTSNFNEISNVFDAGNQEDSLNAKALIKNPNPDPAIDISKQ